MLDTTTRNIVNGLDLTALGEVVEAIEKDAAEALVEFAVKTRWAGQTRSQTTVEGYTLGGHFIPRNHTIDADEPMDLLGQDNAPNPQELLMAAFNACITVGYVAGASVQGIRLDSVEIATRGTLDLRGFLGLSDQVPPGYESIDYTVSIKGDGTPDQFEAIHQNVMKTSPNYFNLGRPIKLNGKLDVR
jgi:uncharacterized OsmC-like protein